MLTSVQLLIQGYDDPEVEVCFNVRPTQSRVVAKQRSGRVLRVDPKNPHKTACIVDFIDGDANRGRPLSFLDIVKPPMTYHQQRERFGALYAPRDLKESRAQRPEIVIEGIEVVVDVDLVLEVIGDKAPSKHFGASPKGWMTLAELNTRIPSVGYRTIKGFIEEIRALHPREFQWCKVPRSGSVVEYMSPTLCESIQRHFTDPVARASHEPPDGWVILTHASKQLGLGRQSATLRKLMAPFIESNPEWVRQYRLTGRANDGQKHDFLSPELMAHLHWEVQFQRQQSTVDKTVIDDGWVARADLQKEFGVTDKTIRKAIDAYEAVHGTSTQGRHVRNGVYMFFCSSELTTALRAMWAQRAPAPDGWRTIGALETELGCKGRAIETAVRRAGFDIEAVRVKYIDRNNRFLDHLPPEVCDVVRGLLS